MTIKQIKVLYGYYTKLKKHGIKLKLSLFNKNVYADGLPCSGYFCNDTKVLAVGIGTRPLAEWFTTLLHEYSHFEQWSSGADVWEEYEKNAYGYGGEGDNHKRYCRATALLELDCEIRTHDKLDVFPVIDKGLYVQRSLAYVAFYFAFARSRRWYNPDNPPYTTKAIYSRMPTTFPEGTDHVFDDWKYSHLNWYLVLGDKIDE